jgi:hypothetical protein
VLRQLVGLRQHLAAGGRLLFSFCEIAVARLRGVERRRLPVVASA